MNMPHGTLAGLADPVIKEYENDYGEIKEYRSLIEEVIKSEEEKFIETLEKGLRQFEKVSAANISGKDAFDLHQTYGFPLEMTVELAHERGLKVDTENFKKELQKHQEVSRVGSEKKFKGGLADTKEETIRLHTAHHLLLAALQKILGHNVKQKGSNITSERLRIDFSHPQKMTPEEIKQVEDLVNEKIKAGLNIVRREMSKERAQEIGAEMEFGAKYGDVVSIYFAEDDNGTVFSKEFCGGPHIKNTSELGEFKILKEEAVSQGVRRIKAILEPVSN